MRIGETLVWFHWFAPEWLGGLGGPLRWGFERQNREYGWPGRIYLGWLDILWGHGVRD